MLDIAQIGPTPSTQPDQSSRRADLDTQAREFSLTGRILTAKIADGATVKLPHGLRTVPQAANAQVIGIDGFARVLAISASSITVLLNGASEPRTVTVTVIQ